MQVFGLTLCSGCRQKLSHLSSFSSLLISGVRNFHTSPATYRKGAGITGTNAEYRRLFPMKKNFVDSTQRYVPHRVTPPFIGERRYTIDEARVVLQNEIPLWSHSEKIFTRLETMKIRRPVAYQLLRLFANASTKLNCFPPEEDDMWQMDVVAAGLTTAYDATIDRALTRRFLSWVLTTKKILSDDQLESLRNLQQLADLRFPSEAFPKARPYQRKFVMHVGPTNSGKTYNALRLLAATERGVYCGPLRLLAHEIFTRLNNGKIVPANADPSGPPESFKRKCNLITGEERIIVDPDAPLSSCTVEMLNFTQVYDFAVIDEIQLIADPQRGGAWTSAILGLIASEIHLCGEEAAIPLIENLVAQTGDLLVVNRYERLSPLAVAKHSLQGSYAKVEKGDCVVAFSRDSIFKTKELIERETGLRCAVAYGGLPPEVRSEQAALFNDRDNDYDVLVASDAVGMGLNLNIKRIVFTTAHKFDGRTLIPLSVPQIKQIAGRAGRFGLHNGSDSGGIVTTLNASDLSIIKEAVEGTAQQHPPLRAVLPITKEFLESVQQELCPSPGLSAVMDVVNNTAHILPIYKLPSHRTGEICSAFIDRYGPNWSIGEKLMFYYAPFPWRSPDLESAMRHIVEMYNQDFLVDIRGALEGHITLESLEAVLKLKAKEQSMNGRPLQIDRPAFLSKLAKVETLYKIVTGFLWLNSRWPITFGSRDEALTLKKEVQDAIDFCLEKVKDTHKNKLKKSKGPQLKSRSINSEVKKMDIPPIPHTHRREIPLRR